jgi:hypothetical protein
MMRALLAMVALLASLHASAQQTPRAAAIDRALAALAQLERSSGNDPAFADACRACDRALNDVHRQAEGATASPADQERWLGLARGRFDSLAIVPRTQRAAAIAQYALAARSSLASDLIQRATAANRPMALLFSTSMSCACTLAKCASLERLFQTMRASSKDIDLIVVDGYHRADLQEKYRAAFLPTLLFIAPDGTEFKRFENTTLTDAEWNAESLHFLAAIR